MSLIQIQLLLDFVLFWNPLFLDVVIVCSNVREPYHL